MKENAALDRLCAQCGIVTEYDDIWGQRRRVPSESRRVLLRAMGYQARTPAQIDAAMRSLEQAQWQRLLPPVMVVRADDKPIVVTLTVPVTLAAQGFNWSLREEGGGQHGGELQPERLEKLAEKTVAGRAYIRCAFALPVGVPLGYHDVEINGGGLTQPARMRLIVAPSRCYQPPGLQGGARVWGLGVQLYSVRSQRNWGLGDFTDLRAVVDLCADVEADLVGVNPLNALFPHNPQHASPYSPASRLFLNVLYLDVEAVPEFDECEDARHAVQGQDFQAALRALRADDLVDYAAVATRKLWVLELLYRQFRDAHLSALSERGRAFQDYRDAQGSTLYLFALCETLQEHFHAEDPSVWGWPVWPEAYRNPDSPAVAAFAAENPQRIEFFEYLQWLADRQLAAVGQRSLERGLSVGIYADLAVGADGGGAEVWANQDLYALGARIGAPPDDFNLKGQDWGLPPLIPKRLTETAYAPFIATLRRNMRHAGALRIDHVMALMRLFWVPPGRPPSEGAYVAYPFQDLLGILALESQRNRCLVIGEDLGTVPQVVRDAMASMGVLAYGVFYFAKDAEGAYRRPGAFSPQALVAVSTHDLPPLRGYWEGTDLERRAQLGLFPTEKLRKQQIVARSEDRARLLLALERENLLPEGVSADPFSAPQVSEALMVAIHAYLARSAAAVMMVQPEDIFGQSEQVNLPGTTVEHPNWRRKLALNVEEWRTDQRVQALAQVMRRERGTPAKAAAVSPPLGPLPAGHCLPTATYRLQFNSAFTFTQAAELVPYLDGLGISHCYASPYLRARPGSQHGYDIIDHNALNPEIGSREDFERFVAVLTEHNMGHILDVVPNHIGIMGSDNAWWLDVLENGQASAYAGYFDIDWEAAREPYRGKVLVPVLGDHYGIVLERAELQLRFDREAGAFSVYYYGHRFPVDPKEYPQILSYRLDRLEARLGAGNPQFLEYQSLCAAFRNLPARSLSSDEARAERARDKEIHKRHVAGMCQRCTDIAWFIEENVTAFNGVEGEQASFQALHRLLQVQAYRLSFWRVASDEINYRRFFDINELAALSMENPEVFEHTHRLVSELLASGKLQGLRVDHPDGLHDPLQYFQRLQMLAAPQSTAAAADGDRGPPYVVVEKILARHERLPDNWPVHGTTGYDFVNLVNGLFVDPEAEAKMDRIYGAFVRERVDFDELVYSSKKQIMRLALASELSVLASQLSRIAEADPRTCDFALNSLRDALDEVVACFPIYRTYITEAGASPEDRRYVDWAVSVAKRRSQAADIGVFDFVRDVLLTVIAEGKPEGYRRAVITFAMKFQQYTGPVMAKGLEDTSFYIYNRLTSLNEVGGEPRHFATSLADFHRANQERGQRWPHTMLATSTHDSKRSEDVRMRINVLSEIPDLWRKHLSRWARLRRSKKRVVNGNPAPSRNDQYLLYQTLFGAWPGEELDEAGLNAFRERIEAYMIKAIREAKVHTSWINVNEEYEEAVVHFVRALLSDLARNPFLADFVPLVRSQMRFGLFNSLSQTLLKFTVPGVPDIYQGNEWWDFSLVDPDNRRPVDYGLRRDRLAELQAWFEDKARRPERVRGLVDRIGDGGAKLFLTWRLLALRREQPLLFQEGSYLPLTVDGLHAPQLCAFARCHEQTTLIVLAPRLFVKLAAGRDEPPLGAVTWGDTQVQVPAPVGKFHYLNLFSGETVNTRRRGKQRWVAAAEVFGNFPVALLIDRPS